MVSAGNLCQILAVWLLHSLTDLLKKHRKFQWTAECQEAFANLKTVLTSAPATPNDANQFKVAFDASDAGIGAVLL